MNRLLRQKIAERSTDEKGKESTWKLKDWAECKLRGARVYTAYMGMQLLVSALSSIWGRNHYFVLRRHGNEARKCRWKTWKWEHSGNEEKWGTSLGVRWCILDRYKLSWSGVTMGIRKRRKRRKWNEGNETDQMSRRITVTVLLSISKLRIRTWRNDGIIWGVKMTELLLGGMTEKKKKIFEEYLELEEWGWSWYQEKSRSHRTRHTKVQ
jgi:hypothetical protein